ncbi:hypothetical protein KR018_000290 [Drosophila ironensis]|nr:hypothetical protein KR018_000290 [Drosophila ironensis]
MDVFIRKELALTTSTSMEDVAPHCQKLIAWLASCQEEMHSQRRRLRITQAQMESLLKAMVYLFECHDRFGAPLAEICSAPEFFATDRRQCIRKLCADIVNTRRGELQAPLLHLMHKHLAEIQPAWGVVRELDWSEVRQSEAVQVADLVQPDLQQMRRLVQRIGRLATEKDMQTALLRAMELIDFKVWLHLFRESRESSVFSDCHLLRHMICDILSAEEPSPACSSFLHHIYAFLLPPGNELRFWTSLEHGRLAGSLIACLTKYWRRYLPHLDLDEMEMSAEATAIDARLPLDEACYVSHLMVATESPCRQKFHQHLVTVLPPAIARQMMQLLSKVAFVYS